MTGTPRDGIGGRRGRRRQALWTALFLLACAPAPALAQGTDPATAGKPAAAKPAAKPAARTATKPDTAARTARPPAAKAETAAKPAARPAVQAAVAAPPPRPQLSTGLRHEYSAAFEAARAGNWVEALRIADAKKNPLASKILLWRYYTSPATPLGTAELLRFLDENPDWPRLTQLRRNLERSLDLQGEEADSLAMDILRRYPPVSALGEARLGEALLRWGEVERGTALIRKAWIEGNFSAERERELWVRHRVRLTEDDNHRRLDRLLWERETAAVQRMLARVEPGRQALAQARLALAQQAGNVDTLIARVPAALQDDPGLAYERARWRRAKNQDDGARAILLSQPGDAARPGAWWTERRIQARRALREGLISDAYKLASSHALPEGGDYAEAEWLSGWIALRFLADPKTALGHFTRLYEAVQFPVSRSRAAYWAGRAAADLKDAEQAQAWYGNAARFAYTYYGQLALQALEDAPALPRPVEPQPEAEDVAKFETREMVRAVRLLAEMEEMKAIDPFVLHMMDTATSDAERLQVAMLARSLGRNDLAVMASKRASRAGTELPTPGYPVIDLPPRFVEEPSLVLALSRQESQFDPAAVSPVGARGLMQLMPATASRTAKSINLPFAVDKLTTDPAYNLTIGTAHVRDLMADYNGSYVLTLIAYNAGPSRVKQWIEQFGDPRWPEVDAIDWVEMIPFDETRNYVQRVMESMAVYRQRLAGDAPVRVTLQQDLKR